MKKKTNKTIIIILALIAVVAVIIGATATLALFTSTAESDAQTFTTGTLTVVYDKNGRQISGAILVPTNEAGAETHTFTITNNGTIAANYTISFTNILLKKGEENTSSANLKWKLYNATKNGNNYTQGAAVEGAEGTFGGEDFTAGDTTLSIKNTGLSLAANGGSQSYILKVWLDNVADNSGDQGISFSAKVTVNATQQ